MNFLFGAVYIIEQDYTNEEIKRDLRLMKEQGFNLITLWPVTNPWLASDSHAQVFDQTRMVLDECESLGLKAILQLFGQNQAQEFMPDSALTKEMMVSDERGEHLNENCFWANLNHPVVQNYMERYFKAAISCLKDHPAVYGYDVFNEAHFRSDDPITLRLYQQWLEVRYGTIENLNHKWYRRYESFAQILPYKRRSPYSIWSSLLPDMEYEKFRSENLTDICRFLYETAKKYDDSHPIIIDGTSGHILVEDITLRNNDEFQTARIPDIYGATFYPKSWGRDYRNTPWTLSMYYGIPAAAARLAGKPYLVNELQTHTQSALTPGSEVTPQELYDWVLMCIFTGADGMQLWRWRPFLHGYQSTGRGLTQMDGTPNQRAEKMKDLGTLLSTNKDIFNQFSRPKPMVKIGVSYRSRLFFDALLKWKESFWSESPEGWYRLFWNHGVMPEFTDLEMLAEEDAPVLVLPSIVSISEQEAVNLEAYVRRGGILIADARMGALNEFGEVPKEGIPGERLSRLFGVKELDVNSGHSFVLEDEEIPCRFMHQELEVSPESQVLAVMDDGTPAVVSHAFGNGETLYFNSFMGMELKENRHEAVEALVLSRLTAKHPQLVTVHKSMKVHVDYVSTDHHTAILVINFDLEEQTVEWSGLMGQVLENRVTGASIPIKEKTSIQIPGNSAYVYSILNQDGSV